MVLNLRRFTARAVSIALSALAVPAGALAAGTATTSNPSYTYTSTAPPGTAEIGTILGWCLWGVGLLCVLGIMGAVAKMVSAHHSGRTASEYVPALGICVMGAIIAGSAGSLIPSLL